MLKSLSRQNFFWTAFVRLDGTHRGARPVPGVATPWIQLAPQRVVQNGKVVAGPLDFLICEGSPLNIPHS